MPETKAALDKMVANILSTIGSAKFWITLLMLIGTGLAAYGFQDPLIKAIMAILGVLTGGTFVASKTYQNTHGINAATTAGAPSVALAMSAPDVAIAVATGISEPEPGTNEPPAPAEPSVSFVKDKIEVMTKIANTDQGLKDILRSVVGARIQEQIAHLKAVNPQLGDDAAVMQVVKQYVNVVLTEKQCAAANALLGMPAVIASYQDQNIVNSFIAAWEQGHYDSSKYIIEQQRQSAIRAMSLRIVEEAANRVKNVNLPIADRIKALMEFGIDEYHAGKSDFATAGVGVWVQPFDSNENLVHGGHLETFNPYVLAGIGV